MINVAQCKGIQISESREFLIVQSGIMGLAILNTAQRIRNPTLMRLESGIQVQLIKNHGTEISTLSRIHGVDPRLFWIHLHGATVDDPRFTANYDLTHYFLQFIQINTIPLFLSLNTTSS